MSLRDATLNPTDYPGLSSSWTFLNVNADPITGEINAMQKGQYIAVQTALYFDTSLRTLAAEMQADTAKFQSMTTFLGQYEQGTLPTTGAGVVAFNDQLATFNIEDGTSRFNNAMAFKVDGSKPAVAVVPASNGPPNFKFFYLPTSVDPNVYISQGAAIENYDGNAGSDLLGIFENSTGAQREQLLQEILPEFKIFRSSSGTLFTRIGNAIKTVDPNSTSTLIDPVTSGQDLKKAIEDAAVKLTQISQGKAAFQMEMSTSKKIWEQLATNMIQREGSDKSRIADNIR